MKYLAAVLLAGCTHVSCSLHGYHCNSNCEQGIELGQSSDYEDRVHETYVLCERKF